MTCSELKYGIVVIGKRKEWIGVIVIREEE
jgi:hypothetical protein